MNNTLLCRYMNIVCKKVVHWYIERYATGYAQKWFDTGYLSLVPPRTRLGQAWTLPWTVTSPERDSPTHSQTSHGQWVKRERLGTRLRTSDTRLTSLRLVFWRIAPWGCLRDAIAFLGCLWYMKSPERLYDKRPLPSSRNPHFQTEAKCTSFLVKMSFVWMRMKNHFHIKGRVLNLVWIQRPGELRNVVKIHEIVPNKKSLFPFFLSWWMKWVHRLVKILSRLF